MGQDLAKGAQPQQHIVYQCLSVNTEEESHTTGPQIPFFFQKKYDCML